MKLSDLDRSHAELADDHVISWYYFIPSLAEAPAAWVDGFRLSSTKHQPSPVCVLHHLLKNLENISNLEKSLTDLPELSQVFRKFLSKLLEARPYHLISLQTSGTKSPFWTHSLWVVSCLQTFGLASNC